MNISKFLLIDTALVIAAIPILLVLQGGNKKYPLLTNFNKEELLKKTSIKLPKKEKLNELEKHAKNKGSGITFDSLLGDWKFLSVWKKNIDEEDRVFSSLLRIFAANIEFKKKVTTECLHKFSVITSIRLGVISMEFSGSGYLKGKQPLLTFFLSLVEIKLGSEILLSKSIEKYEGKEKSFFSLIALEENGKWLIARGQGSRLVIWLKD